MAKAEKTVLYVKELRLNAVAAESLGELLESMVRDRAVLPGECIVALDKFAAIAKPLGDHLLIADEEFQAK